MTTVDLTTELRVVIEDEDSVKFSTDVKLYTILNTAQLEAAALLHNNYLTEFEYYTENLVMPATGVLLTAIQSGYTILKGINGIITVNAIMAVADYEKHAEFVDVKNIRLLDTDDYGGNSDDPRWYVRAGKLYVKVSSSEYADSAFKVDVTFLQTPPTLTLSVDPLLGDAYRSILLDFAEERCWKVKEQLSRAAAARKSAIDVISVLSDKIDF